MCIRDSTHTHTWGHTWGHTHIKYLGDATTNSRCIVQYWFESGREHKVPVRPHGNSKKRKQLFCRTHPSTMKALKDEAQNCPPKDAVSTVYDEKGGMMGATSLGELPRNRDQIQICVVASTPSYLCAAVKGFEILYLW